MPDDPKQNDPPPDDDKSSAEDRYWNRFEERLDKWFDKKSKEAEKNRPTGSSRTGEGRATLPGFLADVMWGPAKR